MIPIAPRKVYIKQEAHEDPRSMARIERMLPFIKYDGEIKIVDDAALEVVVRDELCGQAHGTRGQEIEPIVIFNQFLYGHDVVERERRKQAYPAIFRNKHYAGYSGWDWRHTGDEKYRRETGLVCQPAYAIHSFWGCHFRCAYCNLGNVANVLVNLEDWIEHVREGLAELDPKSDQNLFQWDNGTDVVCWEPEYGGSKMLIDLFAEQDEKYLELYVGKSDYVDFLLDYDHRGHTVCCWSLCTETQCREVEPRTAGMENRLLAARKCQEAGYPVRIRFSPMVPTAGWEAETRHMIRRMAEEIEPEVLTIEPLRFNNYDQLQERFAPGVIDPEFLEAMNQLPPDTPDWEKSEFPDELRLKMYRVVLDEMEKHAPETPVGLCREKRRIWDALRDDFARMGQGPDNYVCNCGPTSAGKNPLLRRYIPKAG